jgi:hypothetical protein
MFLKRLLRTRLKRVIKNSPKSIIPIEKEEMPIKYVSFKFSSNNYQKLTKRLEIQKRELFMINTVLKAHKEEAEVIIYSFRHF